jgi:hypothetical protein
LDEAKFEDCLDLGPKKEPTQQIDLLENLFENVILGEDLVALYLAIVQLLHFGQTVFRYDAVN